MLIARAVLYSAVLEDLIEHRRAFFQPAAIDAEERLLDLSAQWNLREQTASRVKMESSGGASARTRTMIMLSG